MRSSKSLAATPHEAASPRPQRNAPQDMIAVQPKSTGDRDIVQFRVFLRCESTG
jgi:hypothetical protein